MTNVRYIHTCSIYLDASSSQDEYGAPIYTDPSNNTVTSPCRFYTDNSNSRLITPPSGEHAVGTPSVMLPGTVTIDRGYTITSTETGYTHTYTVTTAEPVYWLFSDTVHHWECQLEVVE